MQKKKRKRIGQGKKGFERGLQEKLGNGTREDKEKKEKMISSRSSEETPLQSIKEKQTGSPRQIGVKERASFTWYHKRSLHHWPSINPHLQHGNCPRNPFTAKRTAHAQHRRARHRHPRPCRTRPHRVRGPGRARSRGPQARSPQP